MLYILFYLQIDGVFRGKSIFIDWKSGLDAAIQAHYSTPSGNPLIHRSPNPVFMPAYTGWGFHPFNPWRERFDKVIVNYFTYIVIKVYKAQMDTQTLGDQSRCRSWPIGPLDKADLGTNEERIPNAST
jgi:hypothetical protein